MARCKAGTVYKLARTLGTTVEQLLQGDAEYADTDTDGLRKSFEVFAGNVCHRIKDIGDLEFIVEVIESGDIRRYYERTWYEESFYLLAAVDYLSRVNGLPPCADYEDIRSRRLAEPVYTKDVVMLSLLLKNDRLKEKATRDAIPEFKRFNIMEGDIRDVI
jgi:hypothetical protein